MDPWKLTWEGAWEDQTYAPLYLGNGAFGGQLNASGTDITLWSASHGSVNREATEHPEVRYPLALTRLAVFYRNAYFKERGFWIGRDGILCSDPSYKSEPAMPHRPQVYDFAQALDMRTGLAETTGCVYPGSRSGLHADQGSERALRFHARMAFLKDKSRAAFRSDRRSRGGDRPPPPHDLGRDHAPSLHRSRDQRAWLGD